MIKKQLTRKELIDFLSLANKTVFTNPSVDFREAMFKNKRKIALVVKEPMDSLFPEIDLTEMDRERYASVIPFTEKDENGEPVFTDETRRSVKLQKDKIEDANAAISVVINKYQDKINEKNTMDAERNTWLSKKINIATYSVSTDKIPDVTTVDGNAIDNAMPYFDYFANLMGDIVEEVDDTDGTEVE